MAKRVKILVRADTQDGREIDAHSAIHETASVYEDVKAKLESLGMTNIQIETKIGKVREKKEEEVL